MSIEKYLHQRMLKHAGLLRESIYANPKEELIDVYHEIYRSAYGMRPRGVDFSKYSEEQLQAMIDELRAEMGESTQARITHESSTSAQHEGKTRVTKTQLQRIIKEEVSRVIKEMEFDTIDDALARFLAERMG